MNDRAVIDPALLPGPQERTMLRDSLRAYLEEHWPAAGAVERARDPAALAALWRGLAGQGFAALGADPETGGLRELAIVLEELGRAAAPAPQVGPALVNLALARGAPTTDDEGAARLLSRVQSGDARVALS